MYKGALLFIISSIMLVACAPFTRTTSDSKTRLVKVTYDEIEKQTTYKTIPVKLKGKLSVKMIGVIAQIFLLSNQGLILRTTNNTCHWSKNHEVHIYSDGKKIEVKKSEYEIKSNDQEYTEAIIAYLSYTDLKQIANSKKLKLKIGNYRYKISGFKLLNIKELIRKYESDKNK